MKKLFLLSLAVLLFAGMSFAQTTSNININVLPEASITIGGATVMSHAVGSPFVDYTGTTTLTYMMRTTNTGTISVTNTQFNGAANGTGGPQISDLTFQGSDAAPAATSPAGTADAVTAQTVFTYGANFHSANTGNSATVVWTLPNRPSYVTGAYTSQATFTISAT